MDAQSTKLAVRKETLACSLVVMLNEVKHLICIFRLVR